MSDTFIRDDGTLMERGFGPFPDRPMVFSYDDIQKACAYYESQGFETLALSDGSLIPNLALMNPAQDGESVAFLEVPLNEWSSGYIVRFFKGVPDWFLEYLDSNEVEGMV